jgi:hypothetical protein
MIERSGFKGTFMSAPEYVVTLQHADRYAWPHGPDKLRSHQSFRKTRRLCLPSLFLDCCAFKTQPSISVQLLGKLKRCSEKRRFPHLYSGSDELLID